MVSVIEIQSVSNNNAHYFLKFVKTFSLRKKKKYLVKVSCFPPQKKKKKKKKKKRRSPISCLGQILSLYIIILKKLSYT